MCEIIAINFADFRYMKRVQEALFDMALEAAREKWPYAERALQMARRIDYLEPDALIW